MNNVPLTYKFGGHLMPVEEAVRNILEEASHKDPTLAEAFIKLHSSILNHEISMNEIQFKHEIKKDNRKDLMQTIIYPCIGVIGLVCMVILVLANPFPSKFQSLTLWIIISLSAAAFGAMIPGFVTWKYKNELRAGGGIAIFLIMVLWMKPDFNEDGILKGILYVAKKDSLTVEKIPFTINRNSLSKICEVVDDQLNSYYGNNFSDTFTCYRKSDGMIYKNETCQGTKEGDILLVSNKVQSLYKSKRDAYLRLVTTIKE